MARMFFIASKPSRKSSNVSGHLVILSGLALAAGTLGAFFPPAGIAFGLAVLGGGFLSRSNHF